MPEPALGLVTIVRRPTERALLERHARHLAWWGNAWHVVELAVGWWWADPLPALAIAAVAVPEGRERWRGEACADGCC
jgi:hypothetical protein